MLKLQVKPIVLQQLKMAFPKRNSAEKQLAKYVATLERHLNRTILRHNGFQIAGKWFSISLDDLTHEGGRIGNNPQIWVHSWLEEHGLNLVKVHFKADPIKGIVSKVRLTDLVEVEDYLKVIPDSPESLDDVLNKFYSIDGVNFLETYMPNLNRDSGNDAELAMYDSFPVDSKSIDHFINWLLTKSTDLKYEKKRIHLLQALIIKKAASLFGGDFYQKRKPSPFGRTYYEGLSIQNISKLVRRAVLGDYWQYDANSAVFAFKMGFASGCYADPKSKNKLSLEKTFQSTISLVMDKKNVREMIRKEVFEDDFSLSRDEQIKLVKQAITAIGFGAQLRVKGWIIDGENEGSTALGTIFTNIQCRQRFVDSSFIKSLMIEQKLLNDFIYKETLKTYPHLYNQKEFLNSKKKPIKNKVLAFAYQTGETQVMNAFRSMAEDGGYVPIANIHDAVIFKTKLNTERFQYIQGTIKLNFGEYWTFEPENIEGFTLDREESKKLAKEDEDYWKEKFDRLLNQHSTSTFSTDFGEQVEDANEVVIPPESHPMKWCSTGISSENAFAIP